MAATLMMLMLAAAASSAASEGLTLQAAQAAVAAAEQALVRAQVQLIEAHRRQAEQQQQLLSHQQQPHHRQPMSSDVGLPNGTYRGLCSNCTMYDLTLACLCKGQAADLVATSIRPRSACANPDNISANAYGYLTCEWREAPPPRVGNLTRGGLDDIHRTCRIVNDITFIAPQYSREGAVLLSHPIGNVSVEHQAQACCDLCTAHTRGSSADGSVAAEGKSEGGKSCRAWTILGRHWADPSNPTDFAINGSNAFCHLVNTAATAYPASSGMGQWGPEASNVISGFPLASDAGSFCPALWIDGTSLPYGDEEMALDVGCATLAPHGSTDKPSAFPRKWEGYRGNAWFFLPPASNHSSDGEAEGEGEETPPHAHAQRCNCKCDGSSGCWSATCTGPTMTAAMAATHITGRPWIVFIHGGEFHDWNGISAYYAMLSSKVARAAGMGVLAVDYRNLAASPPVGYPGQIQDIVQALQWLQIQGASELFLYGDSSGGIQVVQTLLYVQHANLNLTVTSAATFSAWLDLTDSSPTCVIMRLS